MTGTVWTGYPRDGTPASREHWRQQRAAFVWPKWPAWSPRVEVIVTSDEAADIEAFKLRRRAALSTPPSPTPGTTP